MEGDAGSKNTLNLIKRAQQVCERLFDRATTGLEITARQFAVLSTVEAFQPLNQTMLEEVTGMDRSTVSDLVWRLERRGLIERKCAVHDLRSADLSLTADGSLALAELTGLVEDVDRSILAVLPESERQEFLQTLKLLASMMDG